jgi:hypothetical protein
MVNLAHDDRIVNAITHTSGMDALLAGAGL